MKKWTKSSLIVAVSAMMVFALAACGGNNNEGNNGGTQGDSSEQKTVSIFQFKTEIVEPLNELAAEFEKEYPNINIEVQTVGGGADYGAALKTKFASNQAPDIFSNGGYAEMDMWFEHLEDLSDQPWVENLLPLAKEPMTKDGKVYGWPIGLEGFGFVYNKDLFEQAGITEEPKTISELVAAAEKLEAAGITPFANGYKEWWLLGLQGVNVAFGAQEDPTAFIQGLSDGTEKIPGNQKFEEWVDLIDLTLKYGNKNPLTTDYNTQLSLFTSGQAAMMQQGNWSQVQLDEISPGMNIGFLPMAANDNAEESDKLHVGVPSNWVINKNSPVKEEAKTFINWLVTSEIGQRYIVEEFQSIPSLSSIEVAEGAMGPLSSEVWEYAQAGKIFQLQNSKFPDGVGQEFASEIQAYIGGQTSREELLQQMQDSWDKLAK
ncbi:ABC transporter substrate-binding protein [Marinicrinis lubricantis]|uniref:ABC transporter substrate-binding protein n=1 Tax=Marinicrinis lubricantis TaxID=2086470 RepID=A0ABW1IJX1_9BACL